MAIVLILGATSDMAQAVARRFAREGYDLQLAVRNTDDLASLQSDLSIRYKISCTLHTFDATDFQSHPKFWNELPVKPDISILVFGYMDDNDFVLENREGFFNTINVNYTGSASILNIISRTYKSTGKGIIAGISSVAGERGRAKNYVYGSAKAGFSAYLSGLRNELFPHGVHVATILPGFVYTRMTENIQLPVLLTAHPKEVADTVYFAVIRKKDIVYVKWFWKWIMLVIRLIPESMFKKMKI